MWVAGGAMTAAGGTSGGLGRGGGGGAGGNSYAGGGGSLELDPRAPLLPFASSLMTPTPVQPPHEHRKYASRTLPLGTPTPQNKLRSNSQAAHLCPGFVC